MNLGHNELGLARVIIIAIVSVDSKDHFEAILYNFVPVSNESLSITEVKSLKITKVKSLKKKANTTISG